MAKVALVVGGTGGLGAACAEDLAKDHTVIVSGRNKDRGNAIVNKIVSTGGKASFIFMDIMDPASVVSLHKAVLDKYGRIDTALNAQGVVAPFVKTADTNKEDFDRCMTINVTGTYLCMQEQIRAMQQNPDKAGGVIVNFSSIYGLTGCKWGAIYCKPRSPALSRRRGAITGSYAAPTDIALRHQQARPRRPHALRRRRVRRAKHPHQRRRAGHHPHRNDRRARPQRLARERAADGHGRSHQPL